VKLFLNLLSLFIKDFITLIEIVGEVNYLGWLKVLFELETKFSFILFDALNFL